MLVKKECWKIESFTYTIQDPLGFHARPAGLLVQKAKEYPHTVITVAKKTQESQATRLFGLMTLGIQCGDTITVTVQGEDEASVAAVIKAFLQKHA